MSKCDAQPCSIETLFDIEPMLKVLADEAISHKRSRSHRVKRLAYVEARNEAAKYLVGIYARDPRLRSSEAYDCFANYILNALNLPCYGKKDAVSNAHR
jgi:hypothetical protein